MKPVDIMIDLKRKLDDSDRLILDKTLRNIEGVIAPWFAPQLKQVMIIYYNPELTNASIVLTAVRHLGYKAKLVSL